MLHTICQGRLDASSMTVFFVLDAKGHGLSISLLQDMLFLCMMKVIGLQLANNEAL